MKSERLLLRDEFQGLECSSIVQVFLEWTRELFGARPGSATSGVSWPKDQISWGVAQ